KEVRVTAGTAPGRLGGDDVTPPGILKALGSKDGEGRAAVLGTLPPIGTFAAEPPRLHPTRDAGAEVTSAPKSEETGGPGPAPHARGTLGKDSAPAVEALGKALEKEGKVKLREGKPYNLVQLEMLITVGEIGPGAVSLAPTLKEVFTDTTAPKHAVSCAALAFLRVADKDADRATAYRAIAKALLLEQLAAPNVVEKELQEKAKKALQRGGKVASKALLDSLKGPFNGATKEQEAARLASYEVWAKLGREAADPNDGPFKQELWKFLNY